MMLLLMSRASSKVIDMWIETGKKNINDDSSNYCCGSLLVQEASVVLGA